MVQRLYEKFLKNWDEKNELVYKTYKKVFESIKIRSKRLHFSNLVLKYKHNIKKTLEVIKESIGKEKCNHQSFPRKNKLAAKDILMDTLLQNNLILILQRLDLNLSKQFKHLH